MKKYIVPFALLLSLGLMILGCDKKDTDFKNFYDNKEVVYPGLASKVFITPGKFRAAILFNPSPDQSVTKYLVYWNNKADSLVVNATNHNPLDTVKIIIPNLKEYVYSFTIYSFDQKGNRSVPLEVNNVKVYGSIYENGLYNRAYNTENPYVLNENINSVKLNFIPTDTIDGFNISTLVKYTNTANAAVEKKLRPDSNVITLPNYKIGTDIQYKSSYVPKIGSLDTFTVAAFSTYPTIYRLVQCDKSIFKEVVLLNDVGVYESNTSISKLWDGSVGPQGYPNIWHSKDGSSVPHVFTFDMGKIYDRLATIEQTGRDCCGNPDKFEVWGISDLSNATTNLKANEAGWKEEMVAKGWTLLREAIRTDGEAKPPMKFDFISNPPPVRYIRIRVTHTVNNGGTSNMSELTFWNKQ